MDGTLAARVVPNTFNLNDHPIPGTRGSHDPQRAVRTLAYVLRPRKAFQLEVKTDHPAFEVNDLAVLYCPEPTCAIAKKVEYSVARTTLRGQAQGRNRTPSNLYIPWG